MAYVVLQHFLYCFIRCNQFSILNVFSFLFIQTFFYFFTYQLEFSLPLSLNFLSSTSSLVITFLAVSYAFEDAANDCYRALGKFCATRVAKSNLSKNFYWNLFDVSKKWFRSWSYAVFITNRKALAKKLFEVCPEKGTKRKNRKKLEWQLESFLR